MNGQGATSRSVIGGLVLLLALNILAWAIIAYSGGKHASDTRAWALQRAGLLDRQTSLEGRLTLANEQLASKVDAGAALMNDLDQREAAIADLQARLDAQAATGEDLKSLRLELASAQHDTEVEKAALNNQLARYRQDVNGARSELSGKTATLAARERALVKVDARLTALNGDIAEAEADLDALNALNAKRGEAEGLLAGVEEKLVRLQGEQATRLAVLGSLDGKISRQREIAEQDNRALQSDLAAVEDNLTARQAELTGAYDRLHGLADEIEQSEDGLAGLQDEIRKGQGKLVDLQVTLAGLHQDREEEQSATRDLNDARKALDAVTASLATREQELAETADRLAKSETTLRQTEVTLTERNEQGVVLEQSIEASEQRLADVDEAVATSEERVAEAEGRLAANDQQIAARQQRIDALKRDEERFRIMVSGLKAHLTEQRRMTADLDGLHAEADAARAERDGQASLLANERRRVALVTAHLEKLETERTALEPKVEAATSELDAKNVIAARLGDVEARLAKRKAELAILDQEQTTKQSLLRDLDAKLNSHRHLEDEFTEAEKRLAALETELDATKTRLDQRRDALAGAEDRFGELSRDIAEAKGTLSTLDVERKAAETALNESQSATSSLDEGLQDKQEALKTVEARLVSYEADAKAAEERLNQAGQAEAATVERLAALEAELDAAASALQQNLSQEIAGAAVRADIKADRALPANNGQAKIDELSGIDPLLMASPVKTDAGIRIAHLLFNYASADLSPGAERKIKEAAAWIQDEHVQTVRLIGYADATGLRDSNKKLSQARAEQTAKALVGLGIDPQTIVIEALGDEVLIEATDKYVPEPLNRSVGIFVGQ